MIKIILSDILYENDIYPLVKAFYPEETIRVLSKDEPEEASGHRTTAGKEQDKPQETISLILKMDFLDDCINLSAEDQMGIVERSTLTVSSRLPKSQYKNAFKRFSYQLLCKLTGRRLPWGILTGIRPTKLIFEMLEQGTGEQQIYQKMREEYLCSDPKISMSLRIAKRELELLHKMDYRSGYSLYIGIPFCPTTCLYCSFPSYSIDRFSDRVEEYLAALDKEIEYASTCFPDKKLTTVYIGGGTPTTLTAGQLDHLLGKVKKCFDFSHVMEFSVEAGRPDSITRDKLLVLKKWGVDRISINPQSMQQKTLDLIGRRHSVDDIREAFALARETGHDNINMDIIIGLPGESPQDVEDTLRQIKELNPDSLTVHTLAIKRAARLNIEKENYTGLKATQVSKMLDETIRFAEENDYLPYYLYRQKNMADNLENIGYARYGKEGLYNILIMEEKQTILALGAGAMSKFVFYEENRIERVDNVKSITDYISRTDELIERKRRFIEANPQL